jgi:fucose permease
VPRKGSASWGSVIKQRILSPIILSLFVLKGINKLEEKVNAAPTEEAKEAILNDFASKVYVPYLIMAVYFCALPFGSFDLPS